MFEVPTRLPDHALSRMDIGQTIDVNASV